MSNEINNISLNQVSDIDSAKIDQVNQMKSDQGQSVDIAQDTIHLSTEAQKLQQLEQRILDLPEIDMERVNSIKAAITEGTYELNLSSLADKLMLLEESLIMAD
jgi:negative regulator of flagellin synthesis FlgM